MSMLHAEAFREITYKTFCHDMLESDPPIYNAKFYSTQGLKISWSLKEEERINRDKQGSNN